MSEIAFTTDATAADTASLKTPEVAAPTFASLAHDTALLRDRVQVTQSDVAELHRTVQLGDLDERTSRVAFQEASELLEALATEFGLSWTTIARMVGVTDAAVRKWRRGDQTTPENRRRLARGVAFLQIIGERFPVRDAASWLEMRISEDATITPLDLYREGRIDLLFELSGARANPHQALDAFDPNWRRNYGVDERFKVVNAPDGEPVIVQRRDM
jgi:hypothetical protein